ncbi:MAG: hypothetical protein IPG50_12205 [Myxococcales bacterium]|nr:hypothetical protein [Myxococcales bacterium]
MSRDARRHAATPRIVAMTALAAAACAREAPTPAHAGVWPPTAPAAMAPAPLESPAASRAAADGGAPFVLGYNEAWFRSHYGSDLTQHFDEAYVAATFAGIGAAGGSVVRLWLFEGLEGITLGDHAPTIVGIDSLFLQNLAITLRHARRLKLSVYLTALDGNHAPAEAGPLRVLYGHLFRGGHGEAAAYEERVLAPLLGLLASHRDVIYGLDLINELQAPRKRGYWPDGNSGAREYVRRTAAFVRAAAPWLRVTASSGHEGGAADLAGGLFSGLGLSFYDLHAYADDGVIGGADAVCRRAAHDGVAVVLGEFGQSSRVDDDALQARVASAFVRAARSSCLQGALAWRYDAHERWWGFVRADGDARPATQAMRALAP